MKQPKNKHALFLCPLTKCRVGEKSDRDFNWILKKGNRVYGHQIKIIKGANRKRGALTDCIVLPSEHCLGESSVLMIWVNVGSRAPARRSLAPTPVPVRVVVGRVVSIRLAVRIVAAKKETLKQLNAVLIC